MKKKNECEELTNLEYSQLKVFHKLEEYKRIKNSELMFEEGYTKYDVLWVIYNKQKDIYLKKKDYTMAGVVYNRMYEILKKEKKYNQALDFLLCCLYLKVYDNFLYERHLVKFMKELKDLLKKDNINIAIFDDKYNFIVNQIKISIKKYLFDLYDDEKINIFQQKINEFLSAY